MNATNPPFSLTRSAFDPNAVASMVVALDDVCRALQITGDLRAREVIAARIIELAGRGERSPTVLRDRILREATGTQLLAV